MNEDFQENPVEKEYVSLYNDVEIHRDQLYKLSMEIITQGVSNYPIFVAHQHPVDLGKLILSKEKNLTNWNISISILEDLVNKEVVSLNKVDEFRKVYKDPEQFFCFLIVTEKTPQFLFIKRSKHNSPLL